VTAGYSISALATGYSKKKGIVIEVMGNYLVSTTLIAVTACHHVYPVTAWHSISALGAGLSDEEEKERGLTSERIRIEELLDNSHI
jgi:hypothetical protein